MEFVYEGECPCVCNEGWDVMEMFRPPRMHLHGDPSIDDYDRTAVGWIVTVIWPVDPIMPKGITDEASWLLTEQVKAWAWLLEHKPEPVV